VFGVKFPLIEDARMDVASKCCVIQSGQSNAQTVCAIFVIDPKVRIRTVLYYPLSTGRNFGEIKRILIVLRKVDSGHAETSADWRHDCDVTTSRPAPAVTAKERMESTSNDQYCLDWFMCFKREKNKKRYRGLNVCLSKNSSSANIAETLWA